VIALCGERVGGDGRSDQRHLRLRIRFEDRDRGLRTEMADHGDDRRIVDGELSVDHGVGNAVLIVERSQREDLVEAEAFAVLEIDCAAHAVGKLLAGRAKRSR